MTVTAGGLKKVKENKTIMLTYFLKHKDAEKLVYEYYPENRLDAKAGQVTIYLKDDDVTLDVVAENDSVHYATANELNQMRDEINKMRIENGEEPYSEEELPTTTEDCKWYSYASHAMSGIYKRIKAGEIPEKGTVAWY